MTFIWRWITGGVLHLDRSTYHEAHRQAVLEFLALDEPVPDLVDAAVPYLICV